MGLGRKILSFLLIAATLAVTVTILAVPGGASRLWVVLVYVLVCPGLAYIRLLNISDPLAILMLGIGLSISMDILVSEALVLTHLWSPIAGIIILGMLCLFGALLQLVAGGNQPSRKEL